jgi:5'-AMP-activated protein kinase catalytic alpha subunit
MPIVTKGMKEHEKAEAERNRIKELEEKRTKVENERIENWKKEIKDIKNSESIEKVLSEDNINRKGYTITRSGAIGSGLYFEVYKARFSEDARQLAVKVILLAKTPQSVKNCFDERRTRILVYLRHNNLVRVCKLFETSEKIYVFMDFAENKTIHQFVTKEGAVSNEKAKKWSKEVANGLQFLHSLGISHRYITAENVLLDMDDIAKLTAFEQFAEYCDPKSGEVVKLKEKYKPAQHLAPEALSGEGHNPISADIWSLGLLIFFMQSKKYPFSVHKNWQNLKIDSEKKKWNEEKEIDKYCRDLLSNILTADVIKRLTIEEVLDHKWLQSEQNSTETKEQKES